MWVANLYLKGWMNSALVPRESLRCDSHNLQKRNLPCWVLNIRKRSWEYYCVQFPCGLCLQLVGFLLQNILYFQQIFPSHHKPQMRGSLITPHFAPLPSPLSYTSKAHKRTLLCWRKANIPQIFAPNIRSKCWARKYLHSTLKRSLILESGKAQVGESLFRRIGIFGSDLGIK